jgi:hypothetical protein
MYHLMFLFLHYLSTITLASISSNLIANQIQRHNWILRSLHKHHCRLFSYHPTQLKLNFMNIQITSGFEIRKAVSPTYIECVSIETLCNFA